MNTSVHAKIKIYSYSLIALSLILILLRILSLKYAFDENIGYFSVSSPLPNITNSILILSILWAASLFIFIPRGTISLPAPIYSTSTLFASALCGFIFFFVGLSNVSTYLHDSTFLFNSEFYQRDLILFFISMISCFLSAAYFFTALISSCQKANWRVLLGFAPIIWAIVALARTYFDFYIAMNDPNKIALHLALMAIMLVLLQELRTLLGRAQPRVFIFFSLIALLFIGIGGVSACIAPITAHPLFKNYYFDLLLVAVLWLYILLRQRKLIALLSPQNTPANTDESENIA